MTVIGEAFIEVSPDTKSFEADMEQGVGGAITGVAKKAALAGGAFLAFGQGANFLKSSITAASDLGEAMSKNVQVFGDWSVDVEQFAEGAAESLGQTTLQAAAATGTFGNLLRAVGLTEKQAAEMSIGMVTLAGDLASFNNANPEEVLEALRSGLVGEAEPLKKFGVNINAARIEAKALELGLVGVGEELTDAAKSQATYALIMQDTTLAQGDFARTSDGLANQQRILSARFGDLQAKIGAAFLPIVTKVVSFLAGPGIDAFGRIASVIGNVASAIGSALSPVLATIGEQLGFFVGALRTGLTEDDTVLPIERVALVLREVLGAALRFITDTAIPAAVAAFGFIRDAGATMFDGLSTAVAFVRDVAIPGALEAFESLKAGFEGTGGEGSFFTDLGEAARKAYDKLQEVIPPIVAFWQDKLLPALQKVGDFVQGNLRPILIGLGVTAALLVAPALTLAAGFVYLYQRFEGFREAVAIGVETIQSLIGVISGALAPVIEFVAEQLGELATFFVENFDQMRQAVTNVVTAIAVVIAVVLAPIVIFFRSWGDEILEIITVVWEQIRNIITTAVDIIKGVITLVMALLTGEWGQAWDAILGIVSTVWSFITESIENALQIILQLVQGVLGGLLDLWQTGWGLVLGALDGIVSSITDKVSGMVTDVIGYFASIPGQLIGLVGDIASAAGRIGGAIVDGLKGALSGAVGLASDLAGALKRAINNTVLRPLRDALTFTIDLPGPLGSFTINGGSLIPLLAKGGIATGPTLGVFGEAGREGVLPLPPGLLEGLQLVARDRLSGQADGQGGFVYAPVLNFPNVTSRAEANAVARIVDDNLTSSAMVRRLQLSARA